MNTLSCAGSHIIDVHLFCHFLKFLFATRIHTIQINVFIISEMLLHISSQSCKIDQDYTYLVLKSSDFSFLCLQIFLKLIDNFICIT